MIIRSVVAADTVVALSDLLPGTPEEREANAQHWLEEGSRHPLHVQVCTEREEYLGGLLGTVTGTGYRILEMHVRPGLQERVLPALVDHVRRLCPGQRLEAEVSVDLEDKPVQRALEQAGFECIMEQIHYGRELTGDLASEPGPFIYRSYEEVGKEGLLEALRQAFAESIPAQAGLEPAAHLEEMLRIATRSARAAGTRLWRAAYLDDPLGRGGVGSARLPGGGGWHAPLSRPAARGAEQGVGRNLAPPCAPAPVGGRSAPL